MKMVVLALLLVSLLISSSFPVHAALSSCNAMCDKRCMKAGIYKRCFKYCCICCNKCNCVPSGTYGNKSECPCYRDMLSSKGKPKCP